MGLDFDRELKTRPGALRDVKRELDSRINRLEQKVDRIIRVLEK